jgi:hypothetical protein
MNVPTTQPAATTSCDRASTPKDADTREPRDPRACDAFALALQNRQRQQRSGDDGEQPHGEPAALAAMPAPPLSGAPTLPPPSRAGALDPAPSGTRAVLEASLREAPCPLVTPVGGGEAAMTWEVSVHEPNSVALEMRAVRAERTACEPQASWGLTIASSSVGAEVLVRHAPRLNERLRKHAIGPEHVRIEQPAEEGDQ